MDYIDLKAYLKKLMSNWLIIVLCCLIAGTGAFIYSKFIATPKYESRISISVTGDWSHSIKSDDINTSEMIIQSLSKLMKEDDAIEEVAKKIKEYSDTLSDGNSEELKLKKKLESLTRSQIKSSITMSSEKDTFLMYVRVVTEDPYVSNRICTAVAAVAPKVLGKVIQSATVTPGESASFNPSQVSPILSRNVVIAVLGAFALVCIVLFVILMFNNKVANEESFKAKFKNITVLGVIPNLDDLKGGAYGRYGKYGKYGR